MGYSHKYFVKPKYDQETFNKIVIDFRKMITPLEHLGIKLANGAGENDPVIDNDIICFNGVTNCGHKERNLGHTWPSKNADGVYQITKQDREDNNKFSSVDGLWCAGLQINTRTCGGDCSHEAFILEQVLDKSELEKGFSKDYPDMIEQDTKTAFKPYDLAVNVCMIIAKHYLKDDFIIKSDGKLNHWKDAIQLCDHFLGYGKDFKDI